MDSVTGAMAGDVTAPVASSVAGPEAATLTGAGQTVLNDRAANDTQPQQKRGILAKLRRRSSSASVVQGRSQHQSLTEDADSAPDDVMLDGSTAMDSERSGRRLSSLVHGVQSLKRRLAARQLATADAERRHHRASVDSRSSDGSELSSSGSEPANLGSNRSSLLSNMSSSSDDSDAGYRGPIVGRARARVDYVPSPYDREALRFKRADIIDVISMNQSGLWRGALLGRVGTFKFINVEMLPDERALLSDGGASLPPLKGRPESVRHLLDELGLMEYASIFSLHGFDCVEDFHFLEADQLSDLGIVDPGHRSSLLGAAQVLNHSPDETGASPLYDMTQPLLSELIRDSGCYDVWRLAEEAPPVQEPTACPTSTEPASSHRHHDHGAGDEATQEEQPGQQHAHHTRLQGTVAPDEGPGRVGVELVHARPAEVTQEKCDDPRRPASSECASSSPPPLECQSSPPGAAPSPPRAASSPPHATSSPQRTPSPTLATSSPPRAPSSPQLTPNPPRSKSSPARMAVDFERKFHSARSVFEPNNCVRRQIPVGVRSRTPLSSVDAVLVGDEVSV